MLAPAVLISTLPALLLLADTTLAAGFDCSKARDGGVNWNFGQLRGQHTVSWAHEHSKTDKIYNSTFLFDICDTMRKTDDMPCKSGTHVCGLDDIINDKGETVEKRVEVVDIAGEYTLSSGGHTDHTWTRLKGSESNADAKKEGVRLKLDGGKSDEGLKQRALIEFLCIDKKEKRSERWLRDSSLRRDDNDDKKDKDEDNEGDDDDGDDDHHTGGSHDDLDKDHPDWAKLRETDDGKGGTIKFVSYAVQGDHKVLRLEWKTPSACEGAADDPDLQDDNEAGGWGFFSWFFFLAFMGILVYFVFFAWINYSRHGATGWDMLPHSDTIRDMPYIIGDWGRKVVGTVQGGSSRGGYSAL